MSRNQPVSLHEFTIPEQMLWDALTGLLRATLGTPAWLDAVDRAHETLSAVCLIPTEKALPPRRVCLNTLHLTPKEQARRDAAPSSTPWTGAAIAEADALRRRGTAPKPTLWSLHLALKGSLESVLRLPGRPGGVSAHESAVINRAMAAIAEAETWTPANEPDAARLAALETENARFRAALHRIGPLGESQADVIAREALR